MIDEDDRPKPKPIRVPPLPLDSLGVSELRDYIAELRGEVMRAEAEIERKERQRSAADQLFRSA